MFRKKYNIIVFGICALLFLLSSILIGINASNNNKYDKTRELYDNKVAITLNDNNIDHEISSVKWKSHKGDFLGEINFTRIATEIEHPEREEGNTTPIKPEEYVLNFKFELNTNFDGEFSIERVTILEENINKKNAAEKYGKIEEMTLVSVDAKKYTLTDTRQDINSSYYQMYVLHFTPNDENVIENYWYFGAYFEEIPSL